MKLFPILLVFLGIPPFVVGQTPCTLAVGSATVAPGGMTVVPVSLGGSCSAVGLQWTFSTGVVLDQQPGEAALSAGKKISCNVQTCLLVGSGYPQVISDGIVALVSILAPGSLGPSALSLINVFAVALDGSQIATSTTDGTLTVIPIPITKTHSIPGNLPLSGVVAR